MVRISDVRTRYFCKRLAKPIADAAHKILQRDVLLVEVITDLGVTGTAFLTGIGVASGSEIPVIRHIVEEALRPLTVGENALGITALWNRLYNATRRYGRKGAVVRALSGIDMAMWDLLGQIAGLPIQALLGGARESVMAYASGGYYAGDLDDFRSEMTRYRDEGFLAVKIKVGSADLQADLKRVEEAREILGPAVLLMVDANENWDVWTALRFARTIQDLNIHWFEEPIKMEDMDGLHLLSSRSPIPIAVGENEYTRWGFHEIVSNGCAHIVQPDVTRVGGVSEWLKVAHYASAQQVTCVPHAVQELHIPLVCGVDNAPFVEWHATDHPNQGFISELFVEPTASLRIDDGFVSPQTKPGFGLMLDEDFAKFHTVDR